MNESRMSWAEVLVQSLQRQVFDGWSFGSLLHPSSLGDFSERLVRARADPDISVKLFIDS